MTLEAFLISQTSKGKRCLLIVDEAQNLTPRAVEELRMLSNFQFGNQALLQSFLVGQPEFREILQQPEMEQLRQRVVATCHIGPLDKARDAGLHRASPEARRLEGRSPVRASLLRFDLRVDRRHSQAHKYALQSAAAGVVPGGEARAFHERRPGDRGGDTRGDGPESGLNPVATIGTPGGVAEGQPPARIDAAIWHRHFHQIEERIDRLETTVGAAVDLLHALLHPDKAAKPGSPKGR